MSYILKLSALCIVCALFSLTIKKHSPELSALIGLAFVIGCMFTAIEIYQLIHAQLSFLNDLTGEYAIYFEPLVKCCGASIITQLSCSVCKDAGQAAAAFAFEVLGSLVSIFCILPLIQLIFQVIEALI